MKSNQDPHAALRQDVKTLGTILGDTLNAHAGRKVFLAVENVRQLAKRARCGDRDAFAELHASLNRLSISEAHDLTRAFAHFLNLANIAEQYHRIRRRRQYRLLPSPLPQRASFAEVLPRLVREGIAADTLYQQACQLSVELVLTAHPTEIARRTVLQRNNTIAGLLANLDLTMPAEPEHEELLLALRREIATAWLTDDIRRQKPTPLDEAKAGLLVFEQSLWNVLPRILRQFNKALQTVTGKELPLDVAPIRFGSWMGGDRDGNPNVTAQVTRQACLLAKRLALQLYLREIRMLRSELSLSICSTELRNHIASKTHEPYRAILRSLRDKLKMWLQNTEAAMRSEGGSPALDARNYGSTKELLTTLLLCQRSLCETGAEMIARGRLEDLIRRVACFGLSLVRLDVRQEASRHAEALSEITEAKGLGRYLDWSETDRQSFLIRSLESECCLAPQSIKLSLEAAEVWQTFHTLAAIDRESLGTYVISMAAQPSDILAVDLFQKEAGILNPLPIVPLFEQQDDLRGAPECMRQLLALPWYQKRINGQLEVMLGYSDSAKGAGRLAADWALYQAQEQLLIEAEKAGIKLSFFHGRGGSPGRGGAPTHQAIMSQPPASVSGRIRVTEQGEMIQAKFGIEGVAERSLEVYLMASLEATARPAPAPKASWRKLMDELADSAQKAYQAEVVHKPSFLAYFQSATPITELGELKIGSRPSRRQSDTGLKSLRAIPWVFAWTQNRLMIPAWLGTGEALQKAIEQKHLKSLRQMYQKWPFFRSIMNLTEMVLAKADSEIAAHYDERLVPAELQPTASSLHSRLSSCMEAILAVSQQDKLLDSNPVLQRSIAVRNPYVDPINMMQIDALHRWRSSPEEREPLLKEMLLTSFNGIAAGMRNTG